MKIDFHTHGKLAKRLPFAPEYTRLMLCQAREAGLDALCLTEHFNTLDFEPLYRYFIENFPREGDCFLCGELRVFSGMEIDISEGGHILVIGPVEEILLLNEKLAQYQKMEQFLPFAELLDLAGGTFLLGAAHPLRAGSNISSLPEELLLRLDFIDLNGKDCAEHANMKERVEAFAKKLDLPVVAGSDTHQFFQYGCVSNRFFEPCATVAELRRAIKSRAYTIEIAETAAYQVRTAGVLKRALKQIDALGGDYLRVLAGR